MDFREAENIHYEYRLKELSTLWSSTLPGINRITYSHLSPGSYTLEVRACENGSYTPVKELRIHIASPWYQTTIAYVCYSIIYLCWEYKSTLYKEEKTGRDKRRETEILYQYLSRNTFADDADHKSFGIFVEAGLR